MAIIHDDAGRRRFLSQAVMGFGLLFGLGALGLRFLQFLIPSPRLRRSEAVLIGSESKIQPGEALALDVGGQKILVLKTDEGVVAFSRRCTDLGCLVSWSKERQQFLCPCHRGVYDRHGKNIAGPPPRPLDRFEIVKRGDRLYVLVTHT
jgi:cytochrome b6-f complex iron-sulfur subunit